MFLKFAKLDNSNKLLTRKCKKTEELLVHYTERLAALQGFASVIALGTIKQRAFSILSNNKLPHLQKLKPYGSENINVQGFPKDSDGKLSIPKDHSIGIIKKPNHNMLTESQKNVLIALDGLCRLESGGARDTLKLFDLVKATPAVSGIELTGLKSALSVSTRTKLASHTLVVLDSIFMEALTLVTPKSLPSYHPNLTERSALQSWKNR